MGHGRCGDVNKPVTRAAAPRPFATLMPLAVALWLGAGDGRPANADPPPRDSAKGRYAVTLLSAKSPIPINEWLDFAIQLQRRDGGAVALHELALDGGMPAHGHGLPTAPTVLRGQREGAFVATGVRFNMAGRWELRVLIVDDQGGDVAVFPVEVGPARAAAHPPERPASDPATPSWSDEQRAILRSLWIRNLGPPPPDVTNRVADDPRAAALGHRLFFDTGLSGNGKIACASCHQPRRYFSDGRAVGQGVGPLTRHTPSLVAVGYARWLFWDGRRDSTWSQALDPLEAPAEMNGTRVETLRHLQRNRSYRAAFQALFGPLPDLRGLPGRASPGGPDAEQAAWQSLPAERQQAITRAFVNVGKAIAAYERRLLPGAAAFDRYIEALEAGDREAAARALSPAALGGLRLFLTSDAQCLKCHNGPLFTNGGFHNIGTGVLAGPRPDFGRMIGLQAILATDLSCLGPYSDDPDRRCPELRFLNRHDEGGALAGAYKVPSLRNVADTAPYMHDGRFASLSAAVRHYRNPGPASPMLEFRPMADMTPDHVAALVAFLEALSGPIDAPPGFLDPPGPAHPR